MKELKLTFKNDDVIVTRFNGTEEDARRYYLGKVFNLGWPGDKMVKCIKVEVLGDIQQTPKSL